MYECVSVCVRETDRKRGCFKEITAYAGPRNTGSEEEAIIINVILSLQEGKR